MKFNENPVSENRVADARKDRQEEAHSRFSQFCGRALNKKGETGRERSMNHHAVCVLYQSDLGFEAAPTDLPEL
jgi:hypothetical protein